jgi:hypothetical protein
MYSLHLEVVSRRSNKMERKILLKLSTFFSSPSLVPPLNRCFFVFSSWKISSNAQDCQSTAFQQHSTNYVLECTFEDLWSPTTNSPPPTHPPPKNEKKAISILLSILHEFEIILIELSQRFKNIIYMFPSQRFLQNPQVYRIQETRARLETYKTIN